MRTLLLLLCLVAAIGLYCLTIKSPGQVQHEKEQKALSDWKQRQFQILPHDKQRSIRVGRYNIYHTLEFNYLDSRGQIHRDSIVY